MYEKLKETDLSVAHPSCPGGAPGITEVKRGPFQTHISIKHGCSPLLKIE